MTQQTLTRASGPHNGGFPHPDVMRGVIAVKLGIPVEFVAVHVDGDSVTFWDTRTILEGQAVVDALAPMLGAGGGAQ